VKGFKPAVSLGSKREGQILISKRVELSMRRPSDWTEGNSQGPNQEPGQRMPRRRSLGKRQLLMSNSLTKIRVVDSRKVRGQGL
jgi:hypothetical protein